jgi:hypothetical protein
MLISLQRAARIRQNQRRCRERKLAYVASLEERLRGYESNGVQANLQLQKLAKRLDSENRKLKRVLLETCGIREYEVASWETDNLIEEVRTRVGIAVSVNGDKRSFADSRSSSFSGGILDIGASTLSGGGCCGSGTAYPSSCTPFSVCCPSAPLSDVRSQKPPASPPVRDDDSQLAHSLLLSMAPHSKIAVNCGNRLNASGERFCSLLQLLAAESRYPNQSAGKTVTCRVSYDLLASLIDEHDPNALENAAFELKDGIFMAEDGCRVDAKMLSRVMEKLSGDTTSLASNGTDDLGTMMVVNA